ncbi:MAG: stage II sporulation protein M [Syntrophaceticus sp.]
MRWRRTSIAINIQKELFIPIVMAVGVFLCGLILGAITLRTLNPLAEQEMHQYLAFYIKEASTYSELSISGLKTWGQILKMQAVSLGLLWIFGLTIVGSPLILLTVGARGFIVGFTVGFLVQEEAGKGLVLALAGVLPQNLCYIPAFLGAGVLSLYFSFTILRSQEAPYRRLGVYSLLFLVFFLLIIIGSWLEAYLVPGLLQLITPLFPR